MGNFTRHEVADAVAYALLTGSSINQNDFRRFCQQSGEHEPSRVFHLIKNTKGIPVRRSTSTGAYFVAPSDRDAWAADQHGMETRWRQNGRERAEQRRLSRLERDLVLLVEKHARELSELVERYGLSLVHSSPATGDFL